MLKRVLSAVAVVMMLAGAAMADDEIYTLYRSSVVAPDMRIHVATFDADDSGPGYNFENCNIAADLFRQQPGVRVRYWCEKGRYRR